VPGTCTTCESYVPPIITRSSCARDFVSNSTLILHKNQLLRLFLLISYILFGIRLFPVHSRSYGLPVKLLCKQNRNFKLARVPALFGPHSTFRKHSHFSLPLGHMKTKIFLQGGLYELYFSSISETRRSSKMFMCICTYTMVVLLCHVAPYNIKTIQVKHTV
jgi:hypothetical protein